MQPFAKDRRSRCVDVGTCRIWADARAVIPASPRVLRQSSELPSGPASPTRSGVPAAARPRSTAAKRRANFAFVPRKAISGSMPVWRARLTTANRRSPISSCRAATSPSASATRTSASSSSILARTALVSVQSKPTVAALAWSFIARSSGGNVAGMSASRLDEVATLVPASAARSRLLGCVLIVVPQALSRRSGDRLAGLAEHVGVPPDELGR